jgi:UDP:flavonoid glycosyltransferase YjiC (YdhE family)
VTTHAAPELEWEGENLQSLGLGVHISNSEMSAESIRGATLQIANDRAMLNRVRRMQWIVQREPGAEEAANRIQEYLERT